jgi:SAM-dependent methyltransferase
MLFSSYAYFSSLSESWLTHAEEFARETQARWHLDANSLVVEVASNDGYLLRHFVSRGVPVLGIDPAENVAAAARSVGVPTEAAFFGSVLAESLVRRGVHADLLVANNVLAHVPDTNDFVAGLARVLGPEGVLSIEFPELATMLLGAQFDQIYHEHVFYFSLLSCESLLYRNGLRVIDVRQLTTHGGSLRVTACHHSSSHRQSSSVETRRQQENELGLAGTEIFDAFAAAANRRADSVRSFLADARANGQRVAAYGAAAKGNTLLNYCGVSIREIAYVVDRSPHKQGRFLPGSHLPILSPDCLLADRPDFILLLAWNLLQEVTETLPEVREWGGHFVTSMPIVNVLP